MSKRKRDAQIAHDENTTAAALRILNVFAWLGPAVRRFFPDDLREVALDDIEDATQSAERIYDDHRRKRR